MEIGCFYYRCFVQADCGLAGNIDKTSGDDKLCALQVAISLLTSEQNACYPTENKSSSLLLAIPDVLPPKF